MEACENDYKKQTEENKPFVTDENDDAKFYFAPYNDKVTTLCEFIEEEKQAILDYANKEDVTIILRFIGYCNMVDGFMGFNFFDGEKEEEDVIDYAMNIVVHVDFNIPTSAYGASLLLSGITDKTADLELLSCHIQAENLKYTN